MMKTIAILAGWLAMAGLVIYAVLAARHAVMFQNPTVTLGLGMVGLGMCMHGKKQLAAAPTTPAERHPRRPAK